MVLMSDKREDADLPEWDTPGTPVDPNMPVTQWDSRTEGGAFTTTHYPPRMELGLNGQPYPTEDELAAQDAWLEANWVDDRRDRSGLDPATESLRLHGSQGADTADFDDEPADIDQRLEAFLQKLSPEDRRTWNDAVVLFAQKFGAALANEGLQAGVETLESDDTSSHSCPECGTQTWREDSDLCSTCLLSDLSV